MDGDKQPKRAMETAKGNQPDPLDETKKFLSRSAQRACVYIGYAPDDESAAERFCLAFESRDTPCWYAARDLTPAMAWPQCVIEAIESSKFFVLLLTDRACHSSDVIAAITEACSRKRSILVLQSADRILNPELEILLTSGHVLEVADPISDQDIDAAWMKIVEIESNSTWGDGTGVAPGVDDTVEAISFLIHLECLRGKLGGKTACQLGVGDRLVFGRGSEADVYVDDERASRRHAGMVVERDPRYGLELRLIDLMSRNGTWVRYRRDGDADISKFLEHTQTRIVNGAIIRIGSTDIRVTAVPIPTNIVHIGS
jgi:TIR domain/FHA domain